MENFIKELQWRGLIHDITNGTEKQFCKELTSAYVGFDPTADSLHIGSLVPIMILIHLQRFGHKPFALVGGATGMVGDPSGKSEERNLLSEETLQHNVKGIEKQLGKFLDFNSTKENAAEIVNNYDWFKGMDFLGFIRDIGKHITINYMMAKESVKKRIEGETGMSFTEFTYQLIQGYDFYWLNKNKNCKVQFGGSDQWGNIVTGTEIIRRKSGNEAFAFTCPLVTKADGGKFGKTEKGNVWLNTERTSPYQFYQFWLNTADADAGKYLKTFTLLKKEEIESLVAEHTGKEHQRLLQQKLAEELTCFVHSKEDYDFAVQASQILFSNQTSDVLSRLTIDQLLQVLEGVPEVEISKASIQNGIDIVSLLAESNILPSKNEARKMIIGGGISLNKIKIDAAETIVDNNFLLHQKFMLIQKGKKNYYLLKTV
ncbi:MAG: tyrosine--tRNA ligase [Ginsengibacter sp.]